MLCHLLGLAGCVFPFGGIIGPLVMWLVQKDKSAYVDYHGKEALNFQITVAIATACCLATFFLIVPLGLALLVTIAGFVFSVIGALKARDGIYYRYPLTLRLLS